MFLKEKALCCVLLAVAVFTQIASTKPQAEVKKEDAKTQDTTPWKVCFYTNWAQYRDAPYGFVPEDIDPFICTHIFFAFSDMDGNELVPYEFNDIEMFARMQALKNTNPNLKTFLAVGGWTFGTAKMTLMMSSRDNRTEFIIRTMSYLDQHGFDGLDLDFEYPAGRGSPAIDKAQFTCLMEEMRDAFDNRQGRTLQLSTGVAAGMDDVVPGYDILRVCNAAHKVNLMSYDFFGTWDGRANPHSPLYHRADQTQKDRQKSVEYAANYWVQQGCNRDKINIGVATYGRSFRLSNPTEGEVGDLISGNGTEGDITKAPGILAYYEILSRFASGETTFHPEHMVPYSHLAYQWVGYEDPVSIQLKGQYIKDNGFGGFMAWNMDFDNFINHEYPLLREISATLDGYVVPIDDTPPPSPIPPADGNFCAGRVDGYYKDVYTCQRCYGCANSTTQVITCPENEGVDPLNMPNCKPYVLMTEEEICLNCFERCDCENLVTPLRFAWGGA